MAGRRAGRPGRRYGYGHGCRRGYGHGCGRRYGGGRGRGARLRAVVLALPVHDPPHLVLGERQPHGPEGHQGPVDALGHPYDVSQGAVRHSVHRSSSARGRRPGPGGPSGRRRPRSVVPAAHVPLEPGWNGGESASLQWK
ncbi:hypothetical protein EF909_26790 [Streptomyces sp. WAC01280]|nr:hypothetical protein EF909_26790 [Streptomyces sp. WAC01280]